MTSPGDVDSIERPWLDHDACYRALASRDRRFDGRVVAAVRTTGIYCRPSCPARTPLPANVEFLATAASAQVRGYRPCRRCRPEAVPGSPDWDLRADVVGRAMRAIDDGLVDREGVDGLARQLGYGRRQLQRLLVAELGAGPLALARARRARVAHTLLVSTDLDMAAVAFAAGFASVRQFNDTMRDLHGLTPTALRAVASVSGRTPRRVGRASPGPLSITLRLAARQPFAGDELLEFWSARAVPGVECVVGGRFERSVAMPHGHAVVSIGLDRVDERTPAGADADRCAGSASSLSSAVGVSAAVRLEDARDLSALVQRIRRWADLDADPIAVDAALGSDPRLAPLVRAQPGRRVPGSLDVFETVVRAIVGQQVSVAGARTLVGRIVEHVGAPLRLEHPTLRRVVPGAEELAGIDPEVLSMPWSRRRTLIAVATAVADGRIQLDHAVDRDAARAQLLAVPGIGPWTADYVRLRGLHDPDVMLAGDLGVRRGLEQIGATLEDAPQWRPWRSYAVHHLWSAASGATSDRRSAAGAAHRSDARIDQPHRVEEAS